MMQHRQIPIVGKGHILHGYFALHIPQLPGVRGILDGRLGAHDLYKAVQAREAVGKQLREIGQLAHGRHKGGDIQAERNQIPVIQLAFHDHIAAQGNDDHIHAGEEEFHRAVEQSHGLVEFPLGGLELVVGRVEAGAFHRLVGKGLGGADAGQAGLDLRIDVGHLLLDPHRDPAHPPAHGENHRQEHGDHSRHHQRQLPADGGHHDQRAEDGNGGGEQVLRPVMGQLRQLKQVGGQPAHQLAGAVIIIKIKAHLLQMAEQVPADIRLHPDAEGVAIIADNVIQPRPQHVKRRRHQHHGKEHPELLIGQKIIQRLPGDQRKAQVDQGNAHRAADIQSKQPLVRGKIAEENLQRSFSLVIPCCHLHILLVEDIISPFSQNAMR